MVPEYGRNMQHIRNKILFDLMLPPRLKIVLPASGLLRSLRGFDNDVSVLPIFKGQAVQEEGTAFQ